MGSNLVGRFTRVNRGAFLSALAAASLAACAPTNDKLSDNKASRASAAHRSGTRPPARNPYSPNVLSDPYVIEQQRATVEALRRSCESTGEHCELAAEAGRYVEEQGAGR